MIKKVFQVFNDRRVEGWKGGRVEGWKGGRVEEWKGGRVEGWKSGRVEGFNRLNQDFQDWIFDIFGFSDCVMIFD